MKVTVMGVGNTLLGDEGVGVHLIRRLGEVGVPEIVELLDGGTRGLALFPYLEETTHLLVVDAVRLDAPAGTVVTLRREALRQGPALKFSAHDVALPDLLNLLELLRGEQIEDYRLVGVVPAPWGIGEELSESVRRALPEAIRQIQAVLQEWIPVHQT